MQEEVRESWSIRSPRAECASCEDGGRGCRPRLWLASGNWDQPYQLKEAGLGSYKELNPDSSLNDLESGFITSPTPPQASGKEFGPDDIFILTLWDTQQRTTWTTLGWDFSDIQNYEVINLWYFEYLICGSLLQHQWKIGTHGTAAPKNTIWESLAYLYSVFYYYQFIDFWKSSLIFFVFLTLENRY